MSPGRPAKHSSWAYAEEHAPEDAVIESARLRAADLGCMTVSSGTAAALSVFAAASGARSLVEIGTGVGVSGAALLRGAPEDAVLTSIDTNSDHTAAAAQTFREARVASSRTRLITGSADRVLPRLTTDGYDLVFIDAEHESIGEYVPAALRLIRPGGLLIINDALDGDQVPKPAVRGVSTQAMRSIERSLREDENVTTALFPTGSGLLVAVSR